MSIIYEPESKTITFSMIIKMLRQTITKKLLLAAVIYFMNMMIIFSLMQ